LRTRPIGLDLTARGATVLAFLVTVVALFAVFVLVVAARRAGHRRVHVHVTGSTIGTVSGTVSRSARRIVAAAATRVLQRARSGSVSGTSTGHDGERRTEKETGSKGHVCRSILRPLRVRCKVARVIISAAGREPNRTFAATPFARRKPNVQCRQRFATERSGERSDSQQKQKVLGAPPSRRKFP